VSRIAEPVFHLSTTGRRPWFSVASLMFGVAWGANQFAPLLLAYHQILGLTIETNQALFGIYALGLVPALLLCGPLSDRWGRSRILQPAAVTSVLATVVLVVESRSPQALYIGRFLAGVASGAVFAVGTAWIKELSRPPYDLDAGEQTGARRATIALSAGFALGPLIASVIGEWSPSPLIVSYLPHLALMTLAIPPAWRAPETVDTEHPTPSNLLSRLRVPAVKHLRFLTVVVPLAPWVFSAPAVAFVVLPAIVSAQTKGFGIIFAGVCAGLTLTAGVLIQPLARRLDGIDSVRGASMGLGSIIGGLLMAALAASLREWPLVLVADGLLGAGYGLCLVSGLLEVQRLARSDDLAGLTAVFYALTYLGFALPVVLAELERFASYPVLLLCLAIVGSTSLAILTVQSPRHSAHR
jgi:MFS family permease